MAIRSKGVRVNPLSVKDIRELAVRIRAGINCAKGFVDVAELLEFTLPKIYDDYVFEVVEPAEIAGASALTYPDLLNIQLSQSVYERLLEGDGQSRFTAAHELGHLILHRKQASFARGQSQSDHKIYEDSEWQADCFAAEFLMPFEEAKHCSSVDEMMTTFGVSREAATCRLEKVQNEKRRYNNSGV